MKPPKPRVYISDKEARLRRKLGIAIDPRVPLPAKLAGRVHLIDDVITPNADAGELLPILELMLAQRGPVVSVRRPTIQAIIRCLRAGLVLRAQAVRHERLTGRGRKSQASVPTRARS